MSEHLERLAYGEVVAEVKHYLLKLASRVYQCEGSFRNLEQLTPGSSVRQVFRCKSWLCQRCQTIRAGRLRANTAAFFEENEPAFRGQEFYCLTLTVPHSSGLGQDTSTYIRKLLDAFSQVRGGTGDRHQQAWWKTHIAGGLYAVEILPPTLKKAAHDTTLHVHMHCLLLATQELQVAVRDHERSFEERLRDDWASRTGASDRGACLERIYWREGRTKTQYQPSLGHGPVEFIRAMKGAVGYITKGIAPELFQTLPARELYALLMVTKRTYSRFGSLYGKIAHQQFINAELLEVDPRPKRKKPQYLLQAEP